jgi:hypothetical protein
MLHADPQQVIDASLAVMALGAVLVMGGSAVQPAVDSARVRRFEAWMRRTGMDPANWDDRKAAMAWSKPGRSVRRRERASLILAATGGLIIVAAFACMAAFADEKAEQDAQGSVSVSRLA